MGEYLFGKDFTKYQGVTDPVLQERLLAAESKYRPQYAALELQDINAYLMGANGQKGVIDLTAEATRRSAELDREAQAMQRQQDIDSLTRYGAQTTDALRNADPYSRGLAEQQTAMANQLYDQAQRVTPEQQRMAEQQARQAGLASGRIGDNSTIAAQILGRENIMQLRRQEAQQAGGIAYGFNRGLSGDIANVILGRPSNASAMGSQFFGQAAGLGQGPTGPQLFDPNAGVNIALQNSANKANYQASTYGAKVAAQAAVQGAAIGALGGMGAAGITKCWVAREVYGVKNPKWKLFRTWLETEAPKWFHALYCAYGERFAGFIRTKPRLKKLIQKWMDARIKHL